VMRGWLVLRERISTEGDQAFPRHLPT
jgi:hypothetical protein